MPIGTSSGEYFEDQYDYVSRRPVINPDEDPRFMTNDWNVVTPQEVETNKQADQMEVDPSTGTGIPIGLKRVEITGGTIDSGMPPEASTEPADALKSGEGSQVPGKEPETNFFQRLSLINPIKAMLKGPNFEEDKALLSGFYESVKNAFKLPGDVYAGKIDPMSPQGIERAFDLAGLAVLGPAPVAAKMADGTLGSFAGVKSQTLAKSNELKSQRAYAQVLEQKGVDSDDIFTTTGFFRGVDGKWRYEIDDSVAKVNEHWVLRTSAVPLPEVLEHPELYKAYPQLKNVNVVLEDVPGQSASWSSGNKTITVGTDSATSKDILMHEIQHAIQGIEGFSQGGAAVSYPSPVFQLKLERDYKRYVEQSKVRWDDINKKYEQKGALGLTNDDLDFIAKESKIKDTYIRYLQEANREASENYLRLAGETEARNVQTRIDMDARWRASVPPSQTSDLRPEQQIVSQKPSWTTPYGAYDPDSNKFIKPPKR